MRAAATIKNEPVQSGPDASALRRIIVVADDYEFLDTVQLGSTAVTYECVIPRTREDFVALTGPPPFAVVVDLDARILDPVEILYILGALSLDTKVVLWRAGIRKRSRTRRA